MFKTVKDGKLPTRGSKYSAAVDLYASEDIVIGAGETELVGLGVSIDIYKLGLNHLAEIGVDDSPKLIEKVNDFKSKHYLQLMLRSSLSKELVIANGVGVVDLDYKDEIKIRLHHPLREYHITWWVDRIMANLGFDTNYNDNNTANYQIKKGDRIAQITLLEHKSYLFGIESDVERDGGFGSTDD